MGIEELRTLLNIGMSVDALSKKAHAEMEPETRKFAKPLDKRYFERKESAVALILYPKSGQHNLLYIKRPVYNGAHSGQVAFPGGKQDPEDENLLHTSIRECKEEIGVSLRKDEYIGELSSLFIPVSNINVVPYLFLLNKEPSLKLDTREVEYVFSVSLEDLMNDTLLGLDYKTMQGEELKIPYFQFSGHKVWGATSMITNELKYMLKKSERQDTTVGLQP